MCGIAGIATLNDAMIEEAALRRMTNVLRHRGPDDEGFYLSRRENPHSHLKVALGHRRLGIIDLAGGRQPMSSKDGTVWIVHNGEIYNFPELREWLIEKGHNFSTRSDTEAIINLYQEKGINCLEDLRGMFAFCIWDAKRNILFIARDRVGKKPLFYLHRDGVFLFGSEIKAILEHEKADREVDLLSLDNYFSYGYAPGRETMFKDIKKLPPAHYLIYDGKDVKIERYWSISYAKKTGQSLPECEERLHALLSEAVNMRLVSDVPLGLFLSGGVDSSCVAALMSRVSPGRIKTFSVGFKESGFDELKHARFISKRFDTEHRELVVEPKALEILPKLAWHYDEPVADSSAIPTYYVSKAAAGFVKVALNGDGGDESFAGYQRYRGVRLAGSFKNTPKAFLKAANKAADLIKTVFARARTPVYIDYARRYFSALSKGNDIKDAYAGWMTVFSDDDKAALYSGALKALFGKINRRPYLHDIMEGSDAEDMVERMINTDILSYLPEDLLVKADRSAMANSLEGRSPFLDHKVMEFAASLPIEYKLKGLRSKHILKRVFEKDIPRAFLDRRKKGFGVPVGAWLSGELKDFAKETLLGRDALRKGFFSKDYVKKILSEHQTRRRDHTGRLWALLSFEMWHRIFIDGKPV